MKAPSPRIVYLIASNDFRMTFKEKGTVIWIFAMPIIFMLAFGLAFRGSSGGAHKARLTVANRDAGFVSRALVDELRKEPLDVVDSLEAGDRAMRTLVIPGDFTERILGREKAALVIRKEKDADVEASEAAGVAVFRALARIVSGLIEIEANALEGNMRGIAFAGDSLSGSLMDVSRARHGFLDSIEVALDSMRAVPPLVTVRSSVAGRARTVPSGFQASVPGNLVMFVLMSMVFSGAAITVERYTGVLKRHAYAPVGKGSILLGKIFGRMGVALVQILFLLLFGVFAFRVSLGNSPGALVLVMIAFAFCTGAFGVFFGSLISNPEQVTAVSVITSLAMSALGGCWWSIELVSPAFKIIAFLFPTGWAMDGIHKLISFGYGMGAVAVNVSVLAAFGVAFVILASWKLRLAD